MRKKILLLAVMMGAIAAAPAHGAILFEEDFNATPWGELPAGWVSVVAQGTGSFWGAAFNVLVNHNPGNGSETWVATPLVMGVRQPLVIEFDYLAQGPTGALVLEASWNGGAFVDFRNLGVFTQNGYDGELTAATGNPLLDGVSYRKVWGGSDGARWKTVRGVIENAPAATSIQLRWRFGRNETPTAQSTMGIDSVRISTLELEGVPGPVATPEPASAALTLGALVLLAGWKRRG